MDPSEARPKPGTLLGGGVVERMEGLIQAMEVEVVIVDSGLTPCSATQS